MFERFTGAARQVVVLAQEEARLLKHNYIGTEHILLGLLREDEGVAARVLESLDLGLERTRREVAAIVGSGEEVTSGQIPFTPRSKKLLEHSLSEALSLKHNYIGTEHILLGLLRVRDGVAVRLLVDVGLDSDRVRRELLAHMRVAGEAAPISDAREHYGKRLAVVETLLAAARRRQELVHVIGDVNDRDAANQALQQLLGVSGELAGAVLDLRLTRLTRSDVQRFEEERQELSERIDELDDNQWARASGAGGRRKCGSASSSGAQGKGLELVRRCSFIHCARSVRGGRAGGAALCV